MRCSVAAALSLAVLATLTTACGDDGESGAPTTTTTATTTSPPPPVGGLVATIGTNRLYALERAFGLRLRNVGDESITVALVQLDSSLFEPVAAAAEEVLLPPGHRGYVLPVPYGEVRCDGEIEPTLGAFVVLDGGDELRLEAAEDDPGAIGRVHDRECAAAEVRELADFGFGDDWVRDGLSVSGDLVLEQRRPGADVAIDDISGSVIFAIRIAAEGSPILHVSDDEPSARVQIVISLDRCDPHAMLESKRTYAFLAWSLVDGSESVPLEVEPTGAVRTALEELLSDCLGRGS